MIEMSSKRDEKQDSKTEADPESMLACASIPENSCIKSLAGMDSGSAPSIGCFQKMTNAELTRFDAVRDPARNDKGERFC